LCYYCYLILQKRSILLYLKHQLHNFGSFIFWP
jgi:hypothetical protein